MPIYDFVLRLLAAAGAGMIIHQGRTIHGLTTVATIWCSSAIGRIAAAGYFTETLISVVIVVFINFVLYRVDKWLDRISGRNEITAMRQADLNGFVNLMR